MDRLLILSVFSGAGGLDLGFRMAGFTPMLAIDIDPAAVATYQHNHPGTRVACMDLASASAQDLVLLWKKFAGSQRPVGVVGGPPCQAFSVANTRQRHDDPRVYLLSRYVSTIETLKSAFDIDFFVFENVPGLLAARHRDRLTMLQRRCEEAGFKVCMAVVDAADLGVPQHRYRVIVAGADARRFPAFRLDTPPKCTHPLTVRDALDGLPEPAYYRRGLDPARVPYHPNHVTMVPRSVRFKIGNLESDPNRRSFRVLEWDRPSYTVAFGHNEVHIHPRRHRRLSVFEAMLLQGFPEWYELKGTLTQQIAMVSNAVPPPVGAWVAREIARQLGYGALEVRAR